MGAVGYSPTNLLAASLRFEAQAGTSDAWYSTPGVWDSEDLFPPTNLVTYRPGRVCRFRALGACQLFFRINTPSTPAIVALLNHNLASGTVMTLEATGSLGGAWQSESLPSPQAVSSWWLLSGALANQTYWRLKISSPVTTDGLPVQIGEIWLGGLVVLPGFAWDKADTHEIQDGFLETDYGVPTVYFLSERDGIEGAFVQLTQADRDAVNNFKSSQQGRVKPFLMLQDAADTSRKPLLGRLTKPSWQARYAPTGRFQGLDFVFAEDPWGKTGA